MATNEGSEAVVHSLEDLTGLAFALLRAIGQPEIKRRYQLYVPAVFKAICLNADSVLRLHPMSVFYTDAGKPLWNPLATAGLARMLMEACVDLHYFAGRDVTEDEREFRGIVADIQRVRARMRTADWMDGERAAGRAPNLPEPDSPQTRDLAWVSKRTRELLPDGLAFWLAQLEGNGYFKDLPPAEQKAWRTGRFPKRTHRKQRNGYALSRTERAHSAGIPAWVHTAVYGLLSEYTHTSAKGLDRIFWFQPFDWVAIASQISLPVSFCCGFVAHAALEFVEVFPACKSQLNSELSLLLGHWRGYITRPGADQSDQSGIDKGGSPC